MSKTYELPLSPNYVKDWGLWEAFREILQNAIDFGEFDLLAGQHSISIVSKGATLDVSTLVLGTSSKGAGDIGKYGEGYKLALLVLARAGISVDLRHGTKSWTPEFGRSDTFNCDVLKIHEEEYDVDAGCVSWTLLGLQEDEVIDLMSKYIGFDGDAILDDPEQAGKIYVKGLYVTTIVGFEKGYNFDVGQIPLNRDRNMSITYNVQLATSKLLGETGDGKFVLKNMLADSHDTWVMPYFCPTTDKNAKLIKSVIEAWKDQYGDSVPVSDEQEIARLAKGVKFTIVSERVANFLHKIGVGVGQIAKRKTTKEKLEELLEQVKDKLSADQATAFAEAIDEL
jgi:hypothetical protein